MIVSVISVLSTAALALPQIQSGLSTSAPNVYNLNTTNPTVTSPTATSPTTIGQLPKGGLNGLPYPDFGALASQLGFDPAKATPDPSG
jgi:hypothetical protein